MAAFTVYMYDKEYQYLKWLVLQRGDIETGGDLFGVWQNEFSAVAQFVLGPGQECRRTTTSFFQDVNYLHKVGEHMTSKEGICNIGEWHSHHRIGLAHPSSGDQNTVWGNMATVSGGRFILFIANIQVTGRVKVGCFMFNTATNKMTEGKIQLLVKCSPIRHTFEQHKEFKELAEQDQDWDTFCTFELHRVETSKRWQESQVSHLERGEKSCVCDVEEETWYCWKAMISCIRWCCWSIISATGHCCYCIFTMCLSGLLHLCKRLSGQLTENYHLH